MLCAFCPRTIWATFVGFCRNRPESSPDKVYRACEQKYQILKRIRTSHLPGKGPQNLWTPEPGSAPRVPSPLAAVQAQKGCWRQFGLKANKSHPCPTYRLWHSHPRQNIPKMNFPEFPRPRVSVEILRISLFFLLCVRFFPRILRVPPRGKPLHFLVGFPSFLSQILQKRRICRNFLAHPDFGLWGSIFSVLGGNEVDMLGSSDK